MCTCYVLALAAACEAPLIGTAHRGEMGYMDI